MSDAHRGVDLPGRHPVEDGKGEDCGGDADE